MCLAAIYWARLKKIYFANTRYDAAAIGFDDAMIYGEVLCDHNSRQIPVIPLGRVDALEVFEQWKNKEDRIRY